MPIAELQEIVARLAKSQEETDRQMKETDRQMKETGQKIKALSELFTGQWGKLVEALVDSGLPTLFQERGIAVEKVSRRQEIFNGREKIAEIDVLLNNGGVDVAVEIKTTCRISDVDDHLERLKKVRSFARDYREGKKKLYGAVVALKYKSDSDSDTYAKRKGLFVLESREGLFGISNDKEFQPKEQ